VLKSIGKLKKDLASLVRVLEVDNHINDLAFAELASSTMHDMLIKEE